MGYTELRDYQGGSLWGAQIWVFMEENRGWRGLSGLRGNELREGKKMSLAGSVGPGVPPVRPWCKCDTDGRPFLLSADARTLGAHIQSLLLDARETVPGALWREAG